MLHFKGNRFMQVTNKILGHRNIRVGLRVETLAVGKKAHFVLNYLILLDSWLTALFANTYIHIHICISLNALR